jgi:primosomal replication protein N
MERTIEVCCRFVVRKLCPSGRSDCGLELQSREVEALQFREVRCDIVLGLFD